MSWIRLKQTVYSRGHIAAAACFGYNGTNGADFSGGPLPGTAMGGIGMSRIGKIGIALLVFALTTALCLPAVAEGAAETRSIRIIGSSDLHGKFVPWDYPRGTRMGTGLS